MTMRSLYILLPAAAIVAAVTNASHARTAPDQCRASSLHNADSLLRASISAVGLDRAAGRVRLSSATDVVSLKYESDRMYPPYLRQASNVAVSADWERGAQRAEQTFGPNKIAYVSDSARRVLYSPRGAQLVPMRQSNTADGRALDPWMVLADWRSARDLRIVGECVYRDYWRTVIAHGNGALEERLFVDTKTAFPIKLDRRDRDLLWGDVHAEYLWSIWAPAGDALAPLFAFRVVDGETDHERIVDSYTMQPRDSAARLDIAADANAAPAQKTPPPPDTVRVSSSTYVLVTPSYSNVVTLQRDTVFVLDAQTSAERAQQDSAWIGKLFPGRHPIVLVVTDLAWPHIAGVRYWVALGVPVFSHRVSREFLQQVVDHKWTVEPDLLERRRPGVRLQFHPVENLVDLGGGAVRLRPIDGIGSEGVLMAYVPSDRFLYASDYIQPGGPGSFSAEYAREVRAAVQRAGFTPDRFVAMHMKLGQWTDIERIAMGGAH
jgi:hypothetical protein